MKIRSLILAIIFQILLLIAMLAYVLMPLYLGKEIKVRVNLYDPRDIFRGNYVSLSYDFSNLQRYKFYEKTGMEIDVYDGNFTKNDEIYAILKQDANATYAFDKFSFTKPKDALFLAGKFDGYSFVKYGIEEFYMPTKKAQQTEQEMLDQDVDAVAVLMVMDDGRARLKDLIITPNGKKRSRDENFDENSYTDDNESLEGLDENATLQDQR
nr:GDYXXLXY domain-containing protein [uncultured Campylobacter sp.]